MLFDTAASRGADGVWQVPLHAWVYEPARSRVRKAAAAVLIQEKFGLVVSEATEANFDRRSNLFFGDNERGRRLRVEVAGTEIELPATAANGHAHAELALALPDEPGSVACRVVLPEADDRALLGRVLLVPPRGVSVISDIDDTVKITEVTDRRALVDNTFFQDFRAVPGMAAKYREWAARGVALHFVSSSPWQLYAPLREFLARSGFPEAVLHLKLVRFKDETLLDLFAPGRETKPRQIEPLLERFPERHFVLVGDSGEQDPEVYADLLRRHPEQILRVYIRNITGARRDDARFGPL